MTLRSLIRHAAIAAAFTVTACSGGSDAPEADQAANEGATAAAALAAIETVQAEATDSMPLGAVPGVVTLPPEARVAVTSPFPGAAVRVLVIEGQGVSRGQPLAVVRAAESMRIGGDLSRAASELQLAEARAARLAQLAEEGIIAQARADEANAQLAQARATLAENRRLASYAGSGPDGSMTLRSPISGRISHVGVETGGPVDGMTAPFVVEATSAYRLDLALPERLGRQVRPGMAVEVDLPTGTGESMTVGGQVLSVAPSIDPETRSVMAKASIGTAPGLVPGQNVSVRIAGTSSENGVAVPSRSVTLIGGEPHVFVRDGDAFVPRAVKVATEAGDRTILSGGLANGETVAASNIAELKAASAE